MCASQPDITTKENNFGSLRLLFAVLVILSHSPELVDGNRSREILTQAFGTLSFGEVAVDGFFLISGYLITKSFLASRSVASYLMKRIARILPGYLVCFLFCVSAVAPYVGADSSVVSTQIIKREVLLLLRILPPEVPGAFKGLPYASLNGSMWTIAYEVRCYLLTAIVGAIVAHRPQFRPLLLIAVLACLFLNATGAFSDTNTIGGSIIGTLENDIRFGAVFGVGSLYYLYKDNVRLTRTGAIIAAAVLLLLLFSKPLAETALAICGGYILFWFSFKVGVLRLSRLSNKTDISYGLYLYAWPIQNLILWTDRVRNPWSLFCLSVVGASLLAYTSWMLVEKPSLNLLREKHHSGLFRKV